MPMIFTADSIKEELRSANKDYLGRNAWNQAFSQVGLQEQLATDYLSTSYDQSLKDAYASALQNRQSIYGGNLGQGFRQMALSENEAALQQAYQSYRQNFLQGKSEVQNTSRQSVSQLNASLAQDAGNMAKMANYVFEYLPYLYKNNEELFSSNALLGRFAQRDENGIITGVKGLSELQKGMFDDTGALNESGIDFVNFITKYGANGELGNNTFSQYLYDKDPALLEWMNSGDRFGSGKTNMSLFNEILGVDSGKYVFDKSSLTEDQIAGIANQYNTTYNNLVTSKDSALEGDTDFDTFMASQSAATKELINFAKSTGKYDKIKDEVDRLEARLKTYAEKGIDEEEWAITNAFADYQELYNKVMGDINSKFTAVDVVDREANYDLVDEEIKSLYSNTGLTEDQFMSKARDVLKDYGTFDIDSEGHLKMIGGGSAGRLAFNISYETSNAGSEDVDIGYDPSKEISGKGFVSLSQWNGSYSGAGSSTRPTGEVAIGRIGNKPVIKVNGKYYYAESEYDTADNRAFMLYLSSFDK